MTVFPRPKRKLHALLVLALIAALVTCSPRPSALSRVHRSGVLRVATINSATTCYEGASGVTGYECDLLQGLAKRLHARLELHFVASSALALAELSQGSVDLAAAGLNVTPTRTQIVRFTQAVQSVQLQLVFRGDQTRPADLSELRGTLAVPANSPMADALTQLRSHYPLLQWDEREEESAEDLLNQVASGDLDYTVANSDLIAIDQHYAPQLRVAFDLSDNQDIAWALPLDDDDTLFKAVQNYLQRLGQAELDRLRDQYFGHVNPGDYQGVVRFLSDVQKLLPRYRAQFEKAATRYQLDWRLLAAIGYQESHWDPDAISPTGVRGIMMLTFETAQRMAISDREDPAQSIAGGARYFREVRQQLPETIDEPDRTWMALAAYNQGLGHVLDARILAEKNGGDPNRWIDVRDALPLLTRQRWYSQTRYGYARGREAVIFVANIRSYYDLLTWMSGGKPGLQNQPDEAALPPSPIKPASAPQPVPAAGAQK